MASFTEKVDWFGLTGQNVALSLLEDDDGATNEYNEYQGQDGSYVDDIVYGEKNDPSNEFALTGDLAYAATGNVLKLGKVNTVDTKKYGLESVSIGTSAGELPTFSASGKQLETGATEDRYYLVPAFTLKNEEAAQILWEAFTLAGTDCHLQSANYTLSANLVTKDKNGLPIAHGIAEGAIECQIEIIQCGTTKPTVTAGTGWTLSGALACSNPDSDCPTWSATLRKHLTKTTASASA